MDRKLMGITCGLSTPFQIESTIRHRVFTWAAAPQAADITTTGRMTTIQANGVTIQGPDLAQDHMKEVFCAIHLNEASLHQLISYF